uniref:protein-serine/threonine phosphatase n=1 Tax=Wollemia nobilis TaxID=56998 RepID=A0A0C9RNT7_9CONI
MGCIQSTCDKVSGSKKQRREGNTAEELDAYKNEGHEKPREDESGDSLDRLRAASNTGDMDAVGVSRLSRLSAQFLPPSGSRVARVPAFNFELKYSYLSQRGYYPEALEKANQDSFCIHTQFGKDSSDHFFGVFDGHGEFGTQCSQFVKKHVCENLLRDREFRTDAVQAYHSAFAATNVQLHANGSIDDSMSGTTAITVLVRGNTLYVANVGDSRAVIAEKRGNDLVALDLSSDQTPFRADECARVKSCGARVMTLDQLEGLKNPNVQCWGGEEDDDGDPPRLWVPNGMYPGTAFTRSVGDTIAENIGVNSVPEVLVMQLTPNQPFFVIASDGVFEFLSSQAVVDMVAKFKDPRDACAAVVAESYKLWLQYETRTDDITIIVVQILGLEDSGAVKPVFDANTRLVHQLSPVEQGDESPLSSGENARSSRLARHDLSRARLRTIESSLEHGPVWVPPALPHKKTQEEIDHIERALQGNFLFNKLTQSQRQMLYGCMEKVQVNAGDIVVRQGGEGDCFYIVQKGEFDVLVSKGDSPGEELGTVVHRYSASNFSCFGELALMYNKPRQASVRAVTDGTVWALKREDFRGVLLTEFTNPYVLNILRSVNVLAKITPLQLNRLAASLSEVSFMDGEKIVDEYESLSAFYIVQQGEVKLTYHSQLDKGSTTWKIVSNGNGWEDLNKHQKGLTKRQGDYFGEQTLLGEQISSITAAAVGNVVCSMITKEKFDLVVGSLQRNIQDDMQLRDHIIDMREREVDVNAADFSKCQLSDLEWQKTVYATDCCEIGLVLKKGSENVLSLKRFSKHKIKQLGREVPVLKEKTLMKSLSSSLFVPQILCTCANQEFAAILLNTCLAGPLAAILHMPLQESSARFISASVVVALELMHKDGVVYRGVSPDLLMVEQRGHLQLVDFRFAKKLSGERAFTICGMADYLAPEIIQGKGHGFAADWWALGVLIYFMLQNELPFGSWRESDLDIFAKIARGRLMFPSHFSVEVIDLLKKLLEVDENVRLGSKGVDSIKNHPWFKDMDWNRVLEHGVPVPEEILTRIDSAFELHYADEHQISAACSPVELKELNTQEWLDGW